MPRAPCPVNLQAYPSHCPVPPAPDTLQARPATPLTKLSWLSQLYTTALRSMCVSRLRIAVGAGIWRANQKTLGAWAKRAYPVGSGD